MFKLILLIVIISYASAGIINLDEGYGYGGYGGYAIAAPKVAIPAPAIAIKAAATSYQNSNLLSLNPTPIVTKTVATAPVFTKVAAPIAVAKVAPIPYPAPALTVVSYGGYGLGGLGYAKY
ncbi:cuticle protein 64-like [Sitophilus oryzae]|uniref:Cuticle protein 64-like n=1 Tax=Sitophilus oryzae TaxID=7048 RepID=A0A6J2YRA3_SITOR|nr:cuticle protein 64-like [Sitophilus oryzae]